MFYRSESVEAFDNFTDSLNELHRAAKAFADTYDAWPIVLSSDEGLYFDSIEFKDPLAGCLKTWTAPSRVTRGQVPRRPPHGDCCPSCDVWDYRLLEHFKRGTAVSKLPVLRVLGVNYFSGAFKWDDLVYFIAPEGARAQKISIGDYDEAKMFSLSRGRSVSMR